MPDIVNKFQNGNILTLKKNTQPNNHTYPSKKEARAGMLLNGVVLGAGLVLMAGAGCRSEPVRLGGITTAPVRMDRDKDGVEDSKDKCPDRRGPAANNGCPVEPEVRKKGVIPAPRMEPTPDKGSQDRK